MKTDVSVRREVYLSLKEYCMKNDLKVSSFANRLCELFFKEMQRDLDYRDIKF